MSDQYAAPSAGNGRRWFVAVLVLMVIAAVAAGATLSRIRGADAGIGAGAGSSAPASPGPSATAPSITVPSAAGAVPSAPAPGTEPEPSREKPKAATPTRKVSSTTSSAPAGPVVSHFRVASQPTCPSGTDQVRYEGQPVVLEWKVTGADRTTLAVDGPGLYAEYGTSGSAKVNFPCSGEPGSYQSHTYTLTAIDGDVTKSKSKTLTVKARIQEITTT